MIKSGLAGSMMRAACDRPCSVRRGSRCCRWELRLYFSQTVRSAEANQDDGLLVLSLAMPDDMNRPHGAFRRPFHDFIPEIHKLAVGHRMLVDEQVAAKHKWQAGMLSSARKRQKRCRNRMLP
jgi:hypothetical protein